MVDILNIPKLGRLEIVEIYDYYNQPVLFSCKDADGNLYLVVAADENDEYETWLYANISIDRLKLIHSDKIDLYHAFADTEDGYVLEVKFPYNNTTPSAEFLKSNQISEDMLPEKGEYLDIEVENLSVFNNLEFSEIGKKEDMLPDRGEYLDIEVENLSVFNNLEFSEIGKKEILDITINFAEGVKTEAPIAFLSHVFISLQNIINAIGSVKLQSKSITANIRSQMELSLSGVTESSFKLEIVPTNKLGLYSSTECGIAIEEFLRLVNAGSNKNELKECIIRLKSKVIKHYTEFLTSLNESVTNTEFTWTSPKTDQIGTFQLSNSQMQEIIDTLQRFQEEKLVKYTITGILIGGSLRTKKLEIATQEKTYKGIIVNKDFKYTVDVTLGKEYTAEIEEVAERNDTTGEITKSDYRLISLKTNDQQGFIKAT